MHSTSYLPEVRNQYEDYPYPPRDPEQERQGLRLPSLDCLDRVNYYCFNGKRDMYRAPFRVLVAGGGTGDAAIALAEQLRDNPQAEVVYLDISTASMAVAKARAAVRQLRNITWIHDSLLNLSQLNLGTFDYINCCGVLHHLAKPEAGLQALRQVMHDQGAMGLMVYGQYGRTAIYLLQELLRQVNKDETDPRVKLENCKKLLSTLPASNWVQRPGFHEFLKSLTDIDLYDAYLHSQDRAYTVPQLYDFLNSAGLRLTQLFATKEPQGNRLYEPAAYIKDPAILAKIIARPLAEQQAIAELMHGNIHKHTFYTTARTETIAATNDLDAIPFLTISQHSKLYQTLPELVNNSQEVVQLISETQKLGIRFQKTPHAALFFDYFDGNRTLKEIFAQIIARSTGTTEQELLAEFNIIFNAFRLHNWMLLRHRSTPAPVTLEAMQARMWAFQDTIV